MNEKIKFILDNPHFSYETLNLKKKLTQLEKKAKKKQQELDEAQASLNSFKETGQSKNNLLSVLTTTSLCLTIFYFICTFIGGLFISTTTGSGFCVIFIISLVITTCLCCATDGDIF